ncbi:hypothetical protein AAHE18_18G245800 [Arachis hypogaea]
MVMILSVLMVKRAQKRIVVNCDALCFLFFFFFFFFVLLLNYFEGKIVGENEIDFQTNMGPIGPRYKQETRNQKIGWAKWARPCLYAGAWSVPSLSSDQKTYKTPII